MLKAQIHLEFTEKKTYNKLGIGCKITNDLEKLPYKDIYWEKDEFFYKFDMIKENNLFIINVCFQYKRNFEITNF